MRIDLFGYSFIFKLLPKHKTSSRHQCSYCKYWTAPIPEKIESFLGRGIIRYPYSSPLDFVDHPNCHFVYKVKGLSELVDESHFNFQFCFRKRYRSLEKLDKIFRSNFIEAFQDDCDLWIETNKF